MRISFHCLPGVRVNRAERRFGTFDSQVVWVGNALSAGWMRPERWYSYITAEVHTTGVQFILIKFCTSLDYTAVYTHKLRCTVPQPARQTAKLFKNGRSQAVRLPAEFRFPGTEVAIRRDETTGEVILSSAVAAKGSWEEFFELADRLGVPDDFLADRELEMATDRDPF
jgi:antitoxin VapB